MAIEIRRAKPEDKELLVKWRLEVIEDIFGKYFTGLPKEEYDAIVNNTVKYYEMQISSGNHYACFAYDGETPVACGGFVYYQELPSPDNLSGKCAYIMNIYTSFDYRQQRIGSKIVEYLIDEAKALGAEKIYLETSVKGEDMYRRLGFCSMNGYMML